MNSVCVGGELYAPTLTVAEYKAAFEPHTGRDGIYAAIERGEIPHIRRGRAIRILTVPAARNLGLDVVARVPNEEKPP